MQNVDSQTKLACVLYELFVSDHVRCQTPLRLAISMQILTISRRRGAGRYRVTETRWKKFDGCAGFRRRPEQSCSHLPRDCDRSLGTALGNVCGKSRVWVPLDRSFANINGQTRTWTWEGATQRRSLLRNLSVMEPFWSDSRPRHHLESRRRG